MKRRREGEGTEQWVYEEEEDGGRRGITIRNRQNVRKIRGRVGYFIATNEDLNKIDRFSEMRSCERRRREKKNRDKK